MFWWSFRLSVAGERGERAIGDLKAMLEGALAEISSQSALAKAIKYSLGLGGVDGVPQ